MRKEGDWLILRKLTIEHFRKIEHYEIPFHEQLTVISDPNTDDIIKAIGMATNNKSLTGSTTSETASDHTHIDLELEIADRPYLITVRGRPSQKEYSLDGTDLEKDTVVDVSKIFRDIRLCEEEENLTYYQYDPKNAFAERFLCYKDPDKYYSLGDFQKKTAGTGLTRSFRVSLAAYIREHEPCHSFLEKYDKKLFDYKCFLCVNEFWDNFENIRDMNHEKWPLIIDTKNLQRNMDLMEALSLGRQLIVTALPKS